MREILFRGKRLDNGELVEGSLVIANDRINNGKCYILPCLSDFSCGDRGNRIRVGNFVEVDPDTVGQYTGLTDKNGQKIFEGDVIKGRNWLSEDRIYQVLYDENGFYCFNEKGQSWHPDHIDLVEVIGNVHDNPELLKGEQHNENACVGFHTLCSDNFSFGRKIFYC